MPDFTYTALAKSGLKSTGTLTAGSEREAAAVLDSRGLFPLQISTAREAGGGRFQKGVSGRDLATFYGQLADLLHSGVPLLRALELLERQSPNKRLQGVLREVRLKVADGTGLAQAMALYPKAFDELAVSMVRAGQEGGFLEDVLKRIAVFVEHQNDMKSKVIGSLAYPIFLGFAGFAVVNILVIFFVPKFEQIFIKMKANGELPILTQGLLGLSHFMQSWKGMLAAVLVVTAVVWFRRWTRGAGRTWADGMKLRIPLFGKVFLSLSLSRFTRILGTMLHNGIPILRALTIAKDSTGNRVLAAAIEQSAENITAGQKLADPFRKCKYFPTDVVEMIAIAEEANSLEKVLIDIADSLEKRTGRNLDLMVKLLEPIMLLTMALAVLLVVLGLLMPVFNLGSTVGGEGG
ncbi:type II secretion system F family protein [Fimbriiglobus ruber]|uniref:General secretion pathway protein F n=1 Tax=Fimbriiglobus ruber TaxID=1908690 RepID=A0A225DW92_9BACT|nr:type II secretion system F family protein [Fimbriiglobus ruber]OWK45661.1 type 4 fimbrial assembly protein pilC [Fimbriiglobus ruber]